MDNISSEEKQEPVVSEILKKITGHDTFTLYGYCSGCDTIHGDIGRLIQYLQFLSDQSMINFN
jgi:hypothetical protein